MIYSECEQIKVLDLEAWPRKQRPWFPERETIMNK